jgi:hypothetical protein
MSVGRQIQTVGVWHCGMILLVRGRQSERMLLCQHALDGGGVGWGLSGLRAECWLQGGHHGWGGSLRANYHGMLKRATEAEGSPI